MDITPKNRFQTFDFYHLISFFRIVRRSGNILSIVTRTSGVEYTFIGGFNKEDWLKTLKFAESTKDISSSEAEIFNHLMQEICLIASTTNS